MPFLFCKFFFIFDSFKQWVGITLCNMPVVKFLYVCDCVDFFVPTRQSLCTLWRHCFITIKVQLKRQFCFILIINDFHFQYKLYLINQTIVMQHFHKFFLNFRIGNVQRQLSYWAELECLSNDLKNLGLKTQK